MAETTVFDIVSSIGQEARLILDWDDNSFYISNITSNSNSNNKDTTVTQTDTTSGVKVAVWNSEYKYMSDDIIAKDGKLYVSVQNQNKGNLPTNGTFWWKPIVDLSGVDARTLEGRNYEEISRDILGGNTISDYYKITETKALILKYINNINAKQLENWSLQNIKDDYNSLITSSNVDTKDIVINYFTSEDMDSYQQSLVDEFSATILPDNINKV
jgi:hypothetical protein